MSLESGALVLCVCLLGWIARILIVIHTDQKEAFRALKDLAESCQQGDRRIQ